MAEIINTNQETNPSAVQFEAPEADRRLQNLRDAAIIFCEVTPINELGRFGALAAAIALSKSNPEVSAAAMGGATALFEVPAAYAAANALQAGRKLKASIDRVSSFTDSVKERLGIAADRTTSIPTKIGLAYLGGSAVSEMVKYREDTTRTTEQNRAYGLRVASALICVSTVQGYVIAAGIEHPEPKTLAGAALGVGSIFGAGKFFKAFINREKKS